MNRSCPAGSALGATLCVTLGAFALASGAAALDFPGGEFGVNATTAGSQFQPAVALAGDGSFVAVWNGSSEDGDAGGIYARRFTAAGAPLGGEFRANTTTAGDQTTPAVATAADGRTMIVWASAGQDGSGYGIVARVFDAAGNPVTGEIAVDTITAGNQETPRVAAAAGGFVVAWTGPDPVHGANFDVEFRRFATTGAPLSAEARANVTVGGLAIQPALAATLSGGFVLAWAAEGADGAGYGIVARLFDASGAPRTGEIHANSTTAFDQTAPTVASTADDGFVVAWESQLQASPTPIGPQPTVFARRFDAAGAPRGGDFQVNTETSYPQESPVAAGDAEGGFVVLWQRTTTGGDGTPDRDVYGRSYDASGAATSGEVTINTTLAGDQIAPALGGDGSGDFVALWASFGQDGSSYGVFGQRLRVPPTACVADATTLCLTGGRFRVRAHWRNSAGATGDGEPVSLTSDTGFFWFFQSSNVEMVVKVLDACSISNNFWVFAGGLTNVETVLTVEDTVTGETHDYVNPQSTPFQPLQDVGHLFVCGATAPADARGAARAPDAPESAGARLARFATTTACSPGDATLCLENSRFSVAVEWTTAQGGSGSGHAVPLTSDTGFFWFFQSSNVEMVIKVLDGCSTNQKYWVFAGGLTNVETRITVTDTAHLELPPKVYTNPQGTAFQPIQDTDAFATCP